MKVLIKREIGSKGMIKKSPTFALHVRAELTPDEEALIKKCGAGETVLHEWAIGRKRDIEMTATVDKITNGTVISCENFIDLIDTEESIKTACGTFKSLLERASTFGEEVVLEF